MHCLDLTLPTPEENLALDEALLLEAEHGNGGEVLRLWESPTPFVVVGIGANVQCEVHWEQCQAHHITVFRRCSGGGTVVQGPGCLNYALILRIPDAEPLSSIHGTNRFIMEQNAAVIRWLKNAEVTVQGYTDLVFEERKVSGNAQRRLKRHLLFHGTFLLNFDVEQITRLLRLPALQPAYREQRSHAEFVGNLGASPSAVKRAMCDAWNARQSLTEWPSDRVRALVAERYSQAAWNLRR